MNRERRLCGTHEPAIHGSTTEQTGSEHVRVHASDAASIRALIAAAIMQPTHLRL